MLALGLMIGPDGKIHHDQLISDDGGIVETSGWQLGMSIKIFLPNYIWVALIVKGGTFATIGLIEVAINVHAMIGSVRCAKVEVVARLGDLPMMKDRVLIFWLRSPSRHNVGTIAQAVHGACKSFDGLKHGQEAFRPKFGTGNNVD